MYSYIVISSNNQIGIIFLISRRSGMGFPGHMLKVAEPLNSDSLPSVINLLGSRDVGKRNRQTMAKDGKII